MNKKHNKNKELLISRPLVVAGAMSGSMIFSIFCFSHYSGTHPLMFILIPAYGITLSMVAILIEMLLSVVTHNVITQKIINVKHSFLLGVSYSTIVLLLIIINEYLILIFIIFNPITMHLYLKNKGH